MWFGIIQGISPYARVATALAPFVIALLLRFILGKNRITAILLSVGTAWLAIHVFLAPFSVPMQQDLIQLRGAFH